MCAHASYVDTINIYIYIHICRYIYIYIYIYMVQPICIYIYICVTYIRYVLGHSSSGPQVLRARQIHRGLRHRAAAPAAACTRRSRTSGGGQRGPRVDRFWGPRWWAQQSPFEGKPANRGSLHYTPEHCNWQMVVSLYCGRSHVSNGCKGYLLRSPGKGTWSCGPWRAP